jgi:hypothetical protein
MAVNTAEMEYTAYLVVPDTGAGDTLFQLSELIHKVAPMINPTVTFDFMAFDDHGTLPVAVVTIPTRITED